MRPYLRLLYSTWAFLLILPAMAAAQQPAATTYTTFIRGNPFGREDVTVRSDTAGLTVTSEGRLGPPANLIIRRAEFRYGPGGAPLAFDLVANANGGDLTIRTSVAGNLATTESSQTGKTSQTVTPQSLLHVNGVVASYVALSRRLGETAPGSEIRVLVVPELPTGVRLVNVQNERMQLGNEFLNARRYEVVLSSATMNTAATITTGVDGNLLSVRVPSQGLDILRADLASVTTRTQVHSNPGDEPVTIQAAGFNLGATVTVPKSATPGARLPAVILISGFGVNDRDGYVLGIPVMGQLAGALANAGFVTVRFDKRGFGQSGGRSESASLTDYADDARTVMRWLTERKDVDPRKVALIGDSDGAWVALLAASRERRVAAIATIGAPASTGAELVLELQKRTLDQLDLVPEERARREALQKQIIAAVQSEKGLADLPRDVRAQADTPWFQSVLNFDPAKVLKEIRQPLLITHAALDHEVPVKDADHLAEIANKESDSKSIELVVIKGVNHLLVPAVTGEIREYGALPDRNLSADVPPVLSGWLTRTFAAIK